jgi:ribonuclease P protein component
MPPPGAIGDPSTTRIGFTVGKGVGGSVTRHAVARRLRWQARSLLTLSRMAALLSFVRCPKLLLRRVHD